MKRRRLVVPEGSAGVGLLAFVAGELRVTEPVARALVEGGAVYVGGKRARAAERPLKAAEVVLVVLEERGESVLAAAGAPSPATPALSVLYEDDALVAVDKPPGIDAQPSPGRVDADLLHLVSAYLGREAGLVHRLDRETSGVTVFGKSSEATRALAAAFREGKAAKRYLAACGPRLVESSGEVDLPLSKDPSRPGRYRASRTANGVPAHTRWERLYVSDAFALVALFPTTGRTHQLRAHLTALGAPILGDARYGGARVVRGVPIRRCLLHAQALQLELPGRLTPLFLEAPVPEDLATWFATAGVLAPTGATGLPLRPMAR